MSLSDPLNAQKKYFVGLAESVLAVPFSLNKGAYLTEMYASYLFSLYEPGEAKLSFNIDFVTLPMLSEFIISVLSESKAVLDDEKRCRCSSTTGLTCVYKKLACLLGHLMKHEQSILDCFAIYCDAPGPPLHYYPDDSLLDGVQRDEDPPSVWLQAWPKSNANERIAGLFSSIRNYYFPTPTSFKLDVIKVRNNELPFLVKDFVAEASYRMVSPMEVLIFCWVFVITNYQLLLEPNSTSLVLQKVCYLLCGEQTPEEFCPKNWHCTCAPCTNQVRP